jgi:hypothetical protein
MFLTSVESLMSEALFERGPSIITKSFSGFAFLITSKTWAVKSGRLKAKSATGVCNLDPNLTVLPLA